MTQPSLREERRGAALLLIMDRPEERNALSTEAQCDEFVAVVRRINADASLKAVVLTGSDRHSVPAATSSTCAATRVFLAGDAVEVAERYRRSLQQIALALHELEMPSIAAVNGPAMGAGLDLACMCDIRIASQQARFAETFIRLGIISGIGGGWFLPRVVGSAVAAEMSFTGRIIDAEQARAIGLVSEVLPAPALLDLAWDLAGEIAQRPLLLCVLPRMPSLGEDLDRPAMLRRLVSERLHGRRRFEEAAQVTAPASPQRARTQFRRNTRADWDRLGSRRLYLPPRFRRSIAKARGAHAIEALSG